VSVDQPREVDRAKVLVHIGGAHVDIEARALSPTRLAEGRVASRDNERSLRVSEDEGEATVRLKGRRRGIMLIGLRHEIWELGVTDRVPLSVDVSGAALRANLDLRKGHATYGEVSGAFNSVTLRLPRPSHQVAIRLEGAFNAFDVIVPEGTPVRYEGPGFPIGWVNKGPAHDGLPDEEPGYRVILARSASWTSTRDRLPKAATRRRCRPRSRHPKPSLFLRRIRTARLRLRPRSRSRRPPPSS
jgi:hypothetical protein